MCLLVGWLGVELPLWGPCTSPSSKVPNEAIHLIFFGFLENMCVSLLVMSLCSAAYCMLLLVFAKWLVYTLWVELPQQHGALFLAYNAGDVFAP